MKMRKEQILSKFFLNRHIYFSLLAQPRDGGGGEGAYSNQALGWKKVGFSGELFKKVLDCFTFLWPKFIFSSKFKTDYF